MRSQHARPPHDTQLILKRLPEIAELRTFLLAADEQSLSRAARRLHLSPAAVAKRLDNLEAVLGYPLLERSPRGVRMTPQGRIFHARAEELVQTAESLLDQKDPAAERLSGVQQLLGRRPARSTELLLADVERLLGHVLDSVSSGIVFHRVTDGIVIGANDAYCTMVGIPREEIVGSPCPWLEDPRYASLHTAVQGGDVVRMSMLTQGSSRDEGAVEVVARRIEIAGEEVLLIVVDDVTRLRETERRLAALVSAGELAA